MRRTATALAAIGLFAAVTPAALAVSGGGYNPPQQDCRANSDASNTPKGQTTKGCHNGAINVEDGHGVRYVEFGLDQLPTGYPSTPGLLGFGYPGAPNSVHSGCLAANSNGTGGGTGKGCGTGKGAGFVLAFNINDIKANTLSVQSGTPALDQLIAAAKSGGKIYMGFDDNLDAGEHDGVTGNHGTQGSANGPSDGGAITTYLIPANASVAPTAANPVPLAGGALGFCADGICFEFTTARQDIYQGCGANTSVKCAKGAPNSREVYNYQGKQWDPYNCSSGDATSEAPGPNGCGSKTMDQWRAAEARNVYAEPGIQIYEDPDPEGSPAGPIYPLPAAYVGTCGVVLGGGAAPAAPASPATNKAGQVVLSPTGC
ncbi:MAG TPA: hypothetical protein VNY84_08640 [Acidimicrobiales bacterium]|nr:hypothetical protein [Acidimicrobiales bacterium]